MQVVTLVAPTSLSHQLLLLPLDTLMFLPLSCLSSLLLHLLMHSAPSQPAAVVMEMPQTSWGISEQNSGVQGLVWRASVGVGSQWGILFL